MPPNLKTPRSFRTVALLYGVGNSTYPFVWNTANKNALGFWVKSNATSGDARGLYMRLYVNGAGGGDAGRFYATASTTGVAAGGTVTGVHGTFSMAAGATISGQATGGRFCLSAAAESRTLAGTLSALQVDSDIGANNTLSSRSSLIRLTKSGSVDVANFLDVSDDQCLKGSGATGSVSDALKCLLPNGDVVYINLYPAA